MKLLGKIIKQITELISLIFIIIWHLPVFIGLFIYRLFGGK